MSVMENNDPKNDSATQMRADAYEDVAADAAASARASQVGADAQADTTADQVQSDAAASPEAVPSVESTTTPRLSPVEIGSRNLQLFTQREEAKRELKKTATTDAQKEAAKFGFRDDYKPEHPTILILHASVGSGHRSAAIAIAQAVEELRDSQAPAFPDGAPLDPQTNVEVADILAWGAHVFNGDKSASMFTGATRPFYDITWRYVFTGRLLWSGGTFLSYIMWRKFTRYIGHIKPMAVIATHIMGANMACGARIICKQDYPIVCVPTDYETEGLWPHKAADCFCVATESMAETLRARRICEDRIAITGIPTRIDFTRTYNAAQVRENLGLPQDKKLVLALAGAYLQQPYVNFRETLNDAIPSLNAHPNMHLVVVCGKDAEYAQKLREMCAECNLANVTVMEYVTEMAKLMAASDLIICKSGGLTVTECLCVETPMILVGRAYGQEKVNVDLLTSSGCAMHVTTTRELIDALNLVSDHPERMESMVVNSRLLRRPHAAEDIVKKALALSTIPVDKALSARPQHGWIFMFYWGDKPAHIR